jgi:hypothetical protein
MNSERWVILGSWILVGAIAAESVVEPRLAYGLPEHVENRVPGTGNQTRIVRVTAGTASTNTSAQISAYSPEAIYPATIWLTPPKWIIAR